MSKLHLNFQSTSTEIIEDELNVKKVSFTDDVSSYTSYTFKPQLRTVGPKYGKYLGQIQKALAELDGNAAMAELKENGFITLKSVSDDVKLAEEDLSNYNDTDGRLCNGGGQYSNRCP